MNTILYKVQAALGARATDIIPVNDSTSIEYTTETGIPVTIYQDPENSEGSGTLESHDSEGTDEGGFIRVYLSS